MKNYAIRSGKYLGILKSIKNHTTIFQMVGYDHEKMDKIAEIIDWLVERADGEAEDLEAEMMPF